MATPTTPTIDPKAITAEITRYVIPALVGLLVSVATKVGFNLSPTQAYAIVAPAVATGYSTLAHALEAKYPALRRILGAVKPASITK
jgi:hypothetical protein